MKSPKLAAPASAAQKNCSQALKKTAADKRAVLPPRGGLCQQEGIFFYNLEDSGKPELIVFVRAGTHAKLFV
jgi:hypothetical protein